MLRNSKRKNLHYWKRVHKNSDIKKEEIQTALNVWKNWKCHRNRYEIFFYKKSECQKNWELLEKFWKNKAPRKMARKGRKFSRNKLRMPKNAKIPWKRKEIQIDRKSREKFYVLKYFSEKFRTPKKTQNTSQKYQSIEIVWKNKIK